MLHSLPPLLALTSCLALLACAPAPNEPGQGDAGSGEASDAAIKPTVLCQHVRDVAAKDTSDAAALDQLQRECVDTVTKLETRYASFAKCVDLAGSSSAITQCEEALAKPPSLLGAASPQAKLEAICTHMLTIVQAELGEVAGNMSAQELQKLRDQCIEKAGEQIAVKGAEQFAKEADCILAAQNLAEIEGCKL